MRVSPTPSRALGLERHISTRFVGVRLTAQDMIFGEGSGAKQETCGRSGTRGRGGYTCRQLAVVRAAGTSATDPHHAVTQFVWVWVSVIMISRFNG